MRDTARTLEALYPLGVTKLEDGVMILAEADCESLKLLLYPAGSGEICETIEFKEEERTGNVWSMYLKRKDFEKFEYCFEADGTLMTDPSARVITGREVWGDPAHAGKTPHARVLSEKFDWDGDKKPEIPYSDTILYRLHVRGFTEHASSKVKNRGTFAGVEEKIPYLKGLGITSVELMPVTEFDEIMMTEGGVGGRKAPSGVLNYWGYGTSFLFALKSSYGSGKKDSPETEFKKLVRSLHKNNMECIMELYLTGAEPKNMITDAMRFWVQEYHVDGFRLSGFAPVDLIGEDPFLKRTKLLAENWGGISGKNAGQFYPAPGAKKVSLREKNLAEYNGQFQEDMRRFLKGDEGLVNTAMFRTRRNPADRAVVNYMANTNGFTMMDMVSYDRKHNEKNGEGNRDGNDYNHSWNCGVEGETKKKKIVKMRRQQLRNAFLLLLLSQGTPLLLAGDEFGNSQEGNNNAYCQDNETGWLNWKNLASNRDIYEFVKRAIRFRKEHAAFHMDREPRLMDYKACGRPDMSYHGESAWQPDSENFRREFGVLYWGPYSKKADGSDDDTFYVAYNMHWEPHGFGLPHLPQGQNWHVVCDTSNDGQNGFYGEGAEPALTDQMTVEVPPRSIMIFRGKKTSGYYTYETPVGEVTVSCRDNALTGIRFGRVAPAGSEILEGRTDLTDRVYAELLEYFAGERTTFDVPILMEGTEFQKKVWNALLEIPFGETRSYKDIAKMIGDEKATRAVGMANNKNPIAIVVPCHRVVGADGSLTGYGGGVEIKEQLLALEKGAGAGTEI